MYLRQKSRSSGAFPRKDLSLFEAGKMTKLHNSEVSIDPNIVKALLKFRPLFP